MNYLFILNDPSYGAERSYNALRLATSLAKSEGGGCLAPSNGRCGFLCGERTSYPLRLLQFGADAEVSHEQRARGSESVARAWTRAA